MFAAWESQRLFAHLVVVGSRVPAELGLCRFRSKRNQGTTAGYRNLRWRRKCETRQHRRWVIGRLVTLVAGVRIVVAIFGAVGHL